MAFAVLNFWDHLGILHLSSPSHSRDKVNYFIIYYEQWCFKINKGWYGMLFTCRVWCIAEVSSTSPSLEQTEREMSAIHQTLVNSKPTFSLLFSTETIFLKLVFLNHDI